MSNIVDRYRDKFQKSGEMFQLGKNVIPGGGHQSRTVYPYPVYIEKGEGSLKWDVDGNQLIDYMMGYGALILGHSHPKVTEAVSRKLSEGTHMGSATPIEIRWAEIVQELIPSAERVRFTASGTETTLLAFRLSRAYTGKRKIVKFREHLHGWHDYVSPESGINTQIGIPKETLSSVIVAEPIIEEIEDLLRRDTDIAAVIIEPTGGHWGQFPLPNPKFLRELRRITNDNNVIMIMDETITGFRMSKGGAQERFNVLPDLTTMGKIVAGGLPGGCIAGKAEIMDLISAEDTSSRIAHPGTFNGNPISAAAGVACLEELANNSVNEQADSIAIHLKDGLKNALSRKEVIGHVHGIASVVHVVLGVECDCNGNICTLPYSEIARGTGVGYHMDGGMSSNLKLAMLNEGIDMMGGIGFMVSSAHTENDVDRTADAFERSLDALRLEGMI